MRLVRIDILLAEMRQTGVDLGKPTSGGYRIVRCPFCGTESAVFARNLVKGARCHNPGCRALLQGGYAWRDMVPMPAAAEGAE